MKIDLIEDALEERSVLFLNNKPIASTFIEGKEFYSILERTRSLLPDDVRHLKTDLPDTFEESLKLIKKYRMLD